MVMDKYELQETLDNLSEIRGRNTELVSIYIPPDYDLRKIIKFLTSEKSEAQNIKSKTTRKNVQSALDKIQRRLKEAGEIPENGIALFAGNVSEREGKTDIQLWEVEPPEPVESRLYKCDKTFVLDPLQDVLVESDVYGLVCLDKSEAAIGYLRGNHLSVEYTLESNVPGKTTKGGQCLDASTRIVLPSGRIRKISEMDEDSKKIISADFEALRLEEAEHNSVFTSLHDQFYVLETRNPNRTIRATGNHKVFVFDGKGVEEKFVEDLDKEDFLISSRKFDIEGEVHTMDVDVPFSFKFTDEAAERIRERRVEREMTQSELGSLADISQTAISKFEKTEMTPSLSTLNDLMDILELGDDFISRFCKREKKFSFPESLNESFAQFLGYFEGDGVVDDNRLEFYEDRKIVADRYISLFKSLFDLEPMMKLREDRNYYRIRLYSKSLVGRLEEIFPKVFDNSTDSSVPPRIQTSEDEIVSSYFRGLFDAEGSVSQSEVSISMVNENLIKEVMLLLQRFGITASITENETDISHEGEKETSYQFRLRISDRRSLKNFRRHIGFTADDKQEKLDDLIGSISKRSRSDKIPLRGSEVRKMAEEVGMNTRSFKKFNLYFRDEKFISYDRFERGILPVFREQYESLSGEEKERCGEIIEFFEGLCEGDITLTKVDRKSLHNLDREKEFYDIEVPDYRNFVADGIIVHNSQQRFERIRENMYDTFLTDIAEKCKKAFLKKAREDELLGIIIGGPGFAKEDLVEKDYLHEKLLDKILARIGTNYSGEEGLEELMGKSGEVISESEAIREQNAVNEFLKNLKKDNGLSVYGLRDVAKALKMGAVEKVLVSEDFEKKEANFECPECGEEEVKHISEFEVENEEHYCDECGAKMDVAESQDVVSMFKKKASQMDSDFMRISRDHEEGERLWNMADGIAAVLRYRIE
ncbi:MAG: LAGLIDADG family homing endonuclease [Candidatus Nanohaloarchaea archaeon]|nr:LAGLIDADG family homing endonuclease [Candidatus Nanohaloarchaea archaeon]